MSAIGRRGGPATSTRVANSQAIVQALQSLFGSGFGGGLFNGTRTPFVRNPYGSTLAGMIPGAGRAQGGVGGGGGIPNFDAATGQQTRLAPGAIPVSSFNALSEAQRNLLTNAGIFTAPAAGANFMQANLGTLAKMRRDPRAMLADDYYNRTF